MSLFSLTVGIAHTFLILGILCLQIRWRWRVIWTVSGIVTTSATFIVLHTGMIPKYICPKATIALQNYHIDYQIYPDTLKEIYPTARLFCHYSSFDHGSQYRMTFHSGGDSVDVFYSDVSPKP